MRNLKGSVIMSRIINRIAIILIQIYRYTISPMFPNKCRFYPTCSSYSIQAFEKYNPAKAAWLSVKRILRCNPFNPGGYDPLK